MNKKKADDHNLKISDVTIRNFTVTNRENVCNRIDGDAMRNIRFEEFFRQRQKIAKAEAANSAIPGGAKNIEFSATTKKAE